LPTATVPGSPVDHGDDPWFGSEVDQQLPELGRDVGKKPGAQAGCASTASRRQGRAEATADAFRNNLVGAAQPG